MTTTIGKEVDEAAAKQASHTPGPWVARQYLAPRECWFVRGPNNERVVSGAQPHLNEANARLIAAAPELLDGLQRSLKLLRKAQDVLTMYLHPDSYDADHAVNLLLELLDGPEQRAIETPARAAIARAEGRT